MYKKNKKNLTSMLFRISFILAISLIMNIATAQPYQSSGRNPTSSKDSNISSLEIYARSVSGSLAGGLGIYALATFINTLNDRSLGESALFTADCCIYPLLSIGTPIGSTLMLMSNADPPVESLKEAWPILAIAGIEIVLYHITFGNRWYKNKDFNSQDKAILGSLVTIMTIIPLSQVWFIKSREEDRNTDPSGALPTDPKSLGLISLKKNELQLGNPGIWIMMPSSEPYCFEEPSPILFLSVLSFNF